MVFYLILQALWFIWPAYCANAFPPLMKGKRPLDFNKNFGKTRFLGDSKTIEGTIGGILFGVAIGLVQMKIYGYIPKDLDFFEFTIPIIVLLSAGALSGDIIGSFIKRRLVMKPGDPAFLLDQLGFLIMALVFAGFIYMPQVLTIIILLIITPVVHVGANILGYFLKLKKHPW